MENFDSDGPPDGEWEDRGELAWNEFDWERYLREQDDAVHRYLGFYDSFRKQADRIDRVAEQMGWEPADAAQDEGEDAASADEAADDSPEFATEEDIYTLHKNPVYVASKAIYLSLKRPWELMAIDSSNVPARLSIPFLSSLHRGEEQASQAIHALDFGDYAMAISLFKRALSALNLSLSLLDEKSAAYSKPLTAYREDALIRLFDLREIWLRVISECRRELNRPVEEE
ncbi:MAG TPA: hypothetical protein VGL42_02300 [Opitutaceae bacterium]